jgi:hypothetical protein
MRTLVRGGGLWRRIAPGRLALAGLGALLLSVGACQTGGHITILGYTTRPNYSSCYKTVRVNIFKDPTFWAVVPVPGLEMELTQAIVREIEAKTPYKVVQGNADTEIVGNIKGFYKGLLTYNQLFEVREAETTLVANVVWRDLKTGKLLTNLGRRPGMPLPEDALAAPPPLASGPLASAVLAPIPATPNSPLTSPAPSTVPEAPTPMQPTQAPPGVPGMPPGMPGAPGMAGMPLLPNMPPPPWAFTMVSSTAHFRPELGESISTAQKFNVDRMAVQIVSMMETPW